MGYNGQSIFEDGHVQPDFKPHLIIFWVDSGLLEKNITYIGNAYCTESFNLDILNTRVIIWHMA